VHNLRIGESRAIIPKEGIVCLRMTVVKNWIKCLHSWLYRLLLPVIVRPPEVMLQGRCCTTMRVGIMRFLDSWRYRIRGHVLDVGAGTWTYPRQMLQEQDGVQYISTDCFEHPNIDVVSDIHHLTDIFEPESFDFLICTDVLEHISRPWVAVRQLHAVLKSGGILLLTTPFNFHLHGSQDYWRI
jgi:2-polyprenyl-3-methyl-5-hydroxy-6-metoxy-1,4-benzoquinol methylase